MARVIQADIVALIEEAKFPNITAHTYIARLGLRQLLKNPDSHKPSFTVPLVQNFYNATKAVVQSLLSRCHSKDALQDALSTPKDVFDTTFNELLMDGHKIWNSADPRHAVTRIDRCQGTSVTGVLDSHYPRHLLYENASDREEIRKQVLGWIIHRTYHTIPKKQRGTRDSSDHDDSTPPMLSTIATTKPLPRSLRQQRKAALSPTPGADDSNLNMYKTPVPNTKRCEQAHTSLAEPDIISVAAHRPCLLLSTGKRPAGEISGGICASGSGSRSNKKSELPAIWRRDISDGGPLLDRGMDGNLSVIPVSPENDDRRAQPTFHGLPITPHDECFTGHTSGDSPAPRSVRSEDPATPATNQCHHDRFILASRLLDLLEICNPGHQKLVEIRQTIELINTIRHDDAHRLRTAYGDAEERYEKTLARWLSLVEAVVEFRERTGFEGNVTTRDAFFRTLTTEQRTSARGFVIRANGVKAELLVEGGFTIARFSRDVAVILFEIPKWHLMGLGDLEELVVNFITKLFAWFD